MYLQLRFFKRLIVGVVFLYFRIGNGIMILFF